MNIKKIRGRRIHKCEIITEKHFLNKMSDDFVRLLSKNPDESNSLIPATHISLCIRCRRVFLDLFADTPSRKSLSSKRKINGQGATAARPLGKYTRHSPSSENALYPEVQKPKTPCQPQDKQSNTL